MRLRGFSSSTGDLSLKITPSRPEIAPVYFSPAIRDAMRRFWIISGNYATQIARPKIAFASRQRVRRSGDVCVRANESDRRGPPRRFAVFMNETALTAYQQASLTTQREHRSAPSGPSPSTNSLHFASCRVVARVECLVAACH
jgi:hypothetical protein